MPKSERSSESHQKRTRSFLQNPDILALSIPALALIVLVIISYAPALDNGFTNWDDPVYVTHNNAISDLSWNGVAAIFSLSSTEQYNHYIPLVILSYAVEFRWFGLDPWIFHATNVVLHALNSVLLLWFLYKLSANRWLAVLAAALFIAHPLNVESVAWVVERKNVLSGLFLLAALIAYTSFVNNPARRRWFWLSFAFTFLSLLAKATAVVAPFLLLLVDSLMKRPLKKKLVTEKIPFMILSGLFSYLVIAAHHPTGSFDAKSLSLSPTQFSVFDRLFLASHSVLLYLKNFFLPTDLSPLYLFPEKQGGWLPVEYLLAPVVLLILAVILHRLVGSDRPVVFGMLFFLVASLPTLQLIPAGVSIAADRYMYIPMIGLVFATGEALRLMNERFLRGGSMQRLGVVLALVTVVLLSTATRSQCGVWKDSVTLWSSAMRQVPNFSGVYLQRGQAYSDLNQLSEALLDFNRAIDLDSSNAIALNNRGNVHARLGRYDKALADLHKAISLLPSYAHAYNNRGKVYSLLGATDSALADFNSSLAQDAMNYVALNNRGEAFLKKGEADRAFLDFDAALRINPAYAVALVNRGNLLYQRGAFQRAVADYSLALRINPHNAEALLNRGGAFVSLGQFENALNDFDQAVRIAPAYGDAYRNRAYLYFQLGRIEKARENVRELQRLQYPVDPAFLARLGRAGK